MDGAENYQRLLACDVTTGAECYDMHRLIVTHKKALFCLLVHHNQVLMLLLLQNVTI